jgi:hypothetical protein
MWRRASRLLRTLRSDRTSPQVWTCDASASRSNECEARANFYETFKEGDVQANSMGLKIRGLVCRIPSIRATAVVLLSVIANRAHTRGI